MENPCMEQFNKSLNYVFSLIFYWCYLPYILSMKIFVFLFCKNVLKKSHRTEKTKSYRKENHYILNSMFLRIINYKLSHKYLTKII